MIGLVYPYNNKDDDYLIENDKIRKMTNILKEEGNDEIQSDVNGSYTGMTNYGEKPVQDADDL